MSKVEVRLNGAAHLAVGLMSGTSHDGVGAALMRIDARKNPPTRLIAFRIYPCPAKFRARLLAAHRTVRTWSRGSVPAASRRSTSSSAASLVRPRYA